MSSPEFNIDTAILLAKFAEQAYEEKGKFDMSGEGFGTFRFIEGEQTDTQAYIAKHDSRAEVVVAFRGTEIDWKDWLTDARFFASGYTYSTGLKGFLAKLFASKRVHSGFFNAYKNARKAVHEEVWKYFGEYSGQKQLFVTGHSLGAALATLCVLDISDTLNKMGQFDVSLALYTYGSPRVGNRQFVKYHKTRVADSWRIVNHEDIICKVPPDLGRLLAYHHIPHCKFIDKDGQFDEANDAKCDKDEIKVGKLDAVVDLVKDAFDPESLGDHRITQYRKWLASLKGT